MAAAVNPFSWARAARGAVIVISQSSVGQRGRAGAIWVAAASQVRPGNRLGAARGTSGGKAQYGMGDVPGGGQKKMKL